MAINTTLLENMTDTFKIVKAANNLVDGWFIILTLSLLFLILFTGWQRYDQIAMSVVITFILTVLSIGLWLIGLVGAGTVGIMIALMIGLFVFYALKP